MTVSKIAALIIALGVSGCQTGAGPTVYLDPASNLGAPSGVTGTSSNATPTGAVATPAQIAAIEPTKDAQGQPNDEFDGQSWIEYRRSHVTAAPRPRMRSANSTGPIPLLPVPGDAELDPSMYQGNLRR